MSITFKTRIPPFPAERLEAISKVLADTSEGLTGSEIDHLLRNCKIPNLTPDMTKWKRLYNAFVEFQNQHQVGNHVVVFIRRSMDPARYVSEPGVFSTRRDRLNSVLAFCGYDLGDDGQARRADAARTIDQALERANRLHAALVQRKVHADVLAFCKAELLQENYFHAVVEAMKSITAKLRKMTGLTSDGCDLVHDAFGQKHGDPLLAINPFQTQTQKGEQNGFMNLLKGLYGAIRNPLAHEAKSEWDMGEQDALDILTMISLLKQTRDSREVDAVLLPRTENGFVDFGSFQELLFDHDLSKTLCIRLEMRLPKQRRHSGHLFQAFPEMKTLSLELQYVRKSPEEEVNLSRLHLYHGEGCLASFVPSALKESNGGGSPSLAKTGGGAFQRMLDPAQRLYQCDQVTASESFWQGCVALVTARRGQLVKALEEVHAALRRPATDFVEDEGGEERKQAAVRKLEDAIRFIGTESSVDQLISWFRQEQIGRLVGLTNFLPVSVVQSQADLKIDDLLSRFATGVLATPDWLPNVASLATVAGIGAGLTLDTLFPLAPYRTAPFRLYYFTGTTPKNVGFKGQRLPTLLFRNRDLLAQANDWLTKLEIGYEIVVHPLGPQLTDMFEVRLRDKNRSTEVLVGLADVGFGISQLLPLVVQSLAGNHQVITIEQPELHIHPKLQADLGDLLIDSIQEPRRNQFIIETHSEHMALRLQRRVREKKLPPNDISVLYVSRGPNGATVQPLRLDDEGDFEDDFPGGFFPERLRELR